MTIPHPALLRLACGRDPGRVADEATFVRSASEHRMVSAVLAAHEAGALRLSTDGATTMAVEALAQRHLHLQLWAGLDVVRQTLTPFGAEVAVLKGIATEGRWYAQLGERTCTDLDLLLDPASQPDTASIVAALDPQRGASGAIHWLVRRRLLQHVDLRVGAVPVDLHLDPLKIGIPTRQLDAVWASTEVLQTPQGSLRVLAPETELILLLLHLNKDGFARLGPFLDVARILERGALDWGALRAFVRGEGLDVPVWKSLELVARILELPVEAPKVGGLRGWTWDRLWARTALRGDQPRGRFSPQPLLGLHATGRTSDNLRELRRQLVPPRPLLEVAGTLAPGQSYVRHTFVNRLRGTPRCPGSPRDE